MKSLENLRAQELSLIGSYFQPGTRVLEIGGGNGYQASLLHALGATVKSIDVAQRPVDRQTFFPVDIYDGRTIPSADDSFDVVFSSNVLEHIQDIDGMMAEIHRVLKVGGVALHILPTPVWRFWTIVAHYVYLIIRVFGLRRPVASGHVPSLREKMQRSGLWATVMRVLVAGPHGEYPSATSELWYYSRTRWLRVFRKNSFHVVQSSPSGIFYTGFTIMPSLSISARQRLARILGSSTFIYVLRKV